MLEKWFTVFIIVVMFTSPSIAGPAVRNLTREQKSFPFQGLGFPFNLDLTFSPCGVKFLRCPRNCAIDPVLIHGYCCECPGVYDFLPIHCPVDIICPYSPVRLCTDFDYLLDCCC